MTLARKYAAATALISLVIFIANIFLVVYQQKLLSRFAFREVFGLEEDVPSLNRLPGYFEEVSMSIQENHHFSLIDDTAWAETMPAKRGFVRLGPKGRTFAISTYHQLHCINAIRFSYTVARDGLVTNPDVLKAKVGHNNHCFQFIRQSILCKADDTLIDISPMHNTTLSHAAFGVTHRCRNWTQVRKFVVENDAKWKGIPYVFEGDSKIAYEG